MRSTTLDLTESKVDRTGISQGGLRESRFFKGEGDPKALCTKGGDHVPEYRRSDGVVSEGFGQRSLLDLRHSLAR